VEGHHSLAALTPGKKPGNVYTGSCVDLSVGVTYFHFVSYQEHGRIKGRASRAATPGRQRTRVAVTSLNDFSRSLKRKAESVPNREWNRAWEGDLIFYFGYGW